MPENWTIACAAGNLEARLVWQERLGVYQLTTTAGEDLGHYGLFTVCANVAACRWHPAR